jgi:hypothetical protein
MNEIAGTGSHIDAILATTELTIRPENFVLVGINPARRRPLEADLASLPGKFFQYTVEADVLTLLVAESEWEKIGSNYPQARVEGPLLVFSFSVAMDWEVVGFLAGVTGLLARHNIPLGAVCGYYRDHLFIAQKYARQAEDALRAEMNRCKLAAG